MGPNVTGSGERNSAPRVAPWIANGTPAAAPKEKKMGREQKDKLFYAKFAALRCPAHLRMRNTHGAGRNILMGQGGDVKF